MNDASPVAAGTPTTEPGDVRRVPSLADLFMGFFVVASTSFGGVLPFARRMIVEQRRWLTGPEFTNLLALGQFLPGPNIVNVAVCIGQRFHGWKGSVAALLGIMGAPVAIVLVLGLLFASYGTVPEVRRAVFGMAAAAAGLAIATGLKMAWPLRRSWWGVAAMVGVATAIAVMRWPLFHVLAVAVPVAVACAWHEKANQARRKEGT